jgi:hypothetical protein
MLHAPTFGEVSYDLVWDNRPPYSMEGTFRLPDGEWQVLIFWPANVDSPVINARARWESGVTGMYVEWPRLAPLNHEEVVARLSAAYGVREWREVRGPDSMTLR